MYKNISWVPELEDEILLVINLNALALVYWNNSLGLSEVLIQCLLKFTVLERSNQDC